MGKISATIITFNEEKNIARCIQSLTGVVDEIVVLDSFSTDDTQKICQQLNVRFHQQKFIGHIEQKNDAIALASYDYILSLDADEALSEELKEEILKIKSNLTGAYCFNRRTRYVNQWIYRCGWYPDVKVRLFPKLAARWGGDNPHDIIELEASQNLSWLKGDLLHYSYDSVSDHVQQTNKFTTIAAKVHYQKGKRSSFFKIITRPLLKFVRDYFFKRGFLDGRYGFIICSINSLSAFLKYVKIYELQHKRPIE